MGVDSTNNGIDVAANYIDAGVWSLGCDITLEDMDAEIQEIRVNDIRLSGSVSVKEVSIDINPERSKMMDLDINVVVDGLNPSIVESQVVPYDNMLNITSGSLEAIKEKGFAASAYSSKKLYDSIKNIEEKINNIGTGGGGGGSLPPEQVEAIEKLLKWFSFDDERGLIKANYGLYSLGSITAGGRGTSSGSVVTSLSALKDVQLSSPTGGQSLVYDALIGMWVNATISGGSTDVTYSSVVEALGYTPFDASLFTKAKIKSTLGISDWALAASKPSYNWSDIGSKPTTLAGYGITDAVRYENEIDPTTTGVPAVMGYRSSAGWKSGGPVMLWGKTGYYTRLNVLMEKSDSPRMYISNVYANTEYDWALFLTDKSIGEHAIAIESDGNNLLVGDKKAKTGYVFGQNGWKTVGPAMTFPQGNYKGLLNMAMYNPATADNGVSAYLGVVYAGSQGKWSLILTEHNIGNYAALKATTLAGYGITDAVGYNANIDLASDYKAIGYGYADKGWHGSGPAMSFGVALYNLRMQLAIETSDAPRIMVSQVYNGTAYGWAELLTREGLVKSYLTAAVYKCYDQAVLHKINGGDTFVNYGGAVNESNSLQLYYGTSFVVSLKGQSVMTMANNGNARFYKDLSVDGTLISNAIYGYIPEGGTYQRYRLVSSGDTMYLQVGAQDGTATTGKLTISGINVATLVSLTIYSQQTLFSGEVQVNGTSRFVSLATFDKGLKIGDATLTWDSAAGMLKTDKGFYSTGAITAGGKSSAGQSPSTSVASTEWYNIKTKRITDKSTIATDIYNIIENFNERLLDDQYRIVLMTFKRKSGQGYGWRIPMFSPRYNADTGAIVHEDTPCAIDWNNTWWPVQSSETLTLNQTGMNITDIINIAATGTRFQRSNSKKIRIGFAIFKKTLDAEGNNVGTWGWQRVSNIAEIMLYYAAKKDMTMIRVIE